MQELNPLEWAVRPLKHYADFSGRAPRAEYWWYAVIFGSLRGLLGLLDTRFSTPIVGSYGPVTLLTLLVFIIPGIALQVRRLHDINRSAWWLLLNFSTYGLIALKATGSDFKTLVDDIPRTALFVVVLAMLGCAIIQFVFMVTPGTQGPNKFGRDPYGPDALQEVFT